MHLRCPISLQSRAVSVCGSHVVLLLASASRSRHAFKISGYFLSCTLAGFCFVEVWQTARNWMRSQFAFSMPVRSNPVFKTMDADEWFTREKNEEFHYFDTLQREKYDERRYLVQVLIFLMATSSPFYASNNISRGIWRRVRASPLAYPLAYPV